MARLHSCNVLHLENGSKHLWQFSGGKFNLLREEVKSANEALPANLAGKDWHTLLKPTLNVACLPGEKVFLRALQLPAADFAEMQSMVELQLEKVSPLPVAQIVWSFEVLPHSASDMQTVVVILVARQFVEEYLGQLEGSGYLADKLELPLIDLLQATNVNEDGVWIYPDENGSGGPCLVAWWYGGVLHNISLISLPAGEQRGAILQNQLVQIMWAGEMEGWITSTPKFHLVADEAVAAAWRNYLPAGYPIETVAPPPATEIANRTARRAASDKPRTPLLPPEYLARYKQRFVDRLWMRGLGAAVMAYVLIVLAYMGWVQFEAFKLRSVEGDIAELGVAYTNTVQIRERMRVLQEQMDLQFAALDCYKAIAETMPAELTLDSIGFDRRKLTLQGSASGEQGVYDFNEKLRNSTTKNQPLFSKVSPPNIRMQGQQYFWTFPCELKRSDNE